ncbi:MAG: hypothetical protein AWU57_1516 [Marinobacter sp. T13-3]|nr:MAG: hypothetical protein AWU57_1516 [Marinobacter sp. T13-3]
MKRIKNKFNPLAFGDAALIASLIPDAVSRQSVSETVYRNATKRGDALESGDCAQAEEVIGRQVELAKNACPGSKH